MDKKTSLKIAYIANARIPTEKAHGYQIVRVCSALKELGTSVQLYVPQRDNPITDDPFTYYNISQPFPVTQVTSLPVMKLVRIFGPVAHVLQGLVFSLKLILTKQIDKEAVVYSRDAEVLWLFGLWGYSTVYNAHNWTVRTWLRTFLLRRVKGVVCNSEGTQAVVAKNISVPTAVIYHGVDENPFRSEPKDVLRTELGLPIATKIALYTGHLYKWKGSEVLFAAAEYLADDWKIVVVGGQTDVVQEYQARAIKSGVQDRILYLGHKSREVIPKYLAAADVLLLPNSAQTTESVEYTAPLKLFEYLAAGRPIIASRLPSIERLLPEDCVTFVSADDPKNLTIAICDIVEMEDKGSVCLLESSKYSWVTHSEQLLHFLSALR